MRQPKMDVLVPSFDPPEQWRSTAQKEELSNERWKQIRMEILRRDNHACRYCDYTAQSFMNVDHIDGNPVNNASQNLQTLCMWCHMVKHSGLHCDVLHSMELYQKPIGLNQLDLIKRTRELRSLGLDDAEIKKRVGLTKRMPFKMDHKYLSELVAFIVSKPVPEKGHLKNYGNITIRYADGAYPPVFMK